ncbi:RNA polymerase primary sigma factor [Alkalispirochaeta americana]|uniref:RNA polymerase primary sigma factor n=1 Tax=Alkalispirochaeta americana TaxID=159291 RepID=A0A1N6PXB1_9SPIO|nr:sigma-70 family RNA polymerase sigma factor [Alkalispirochaeta americana]SIQ08922.1 RNA polymerase primary sigma factor [Alkalispirochaeta americana]
MARKISADYSQNDALQTYYTQIKKNPLLTAEEEWDLSRRIEQGDAEAKRILVERNLRLVIKIAKAYVTPDTTLLDLIQDGNLGLLKAASRFDYRKGVRFSTYAAWWIKQSLSRSLANRRRTIRLPHRKEDVLRRIQRAYNYLNQHLMRTPSVEEIAREAHISPEEVSEIMNIAATPVSLDTEINDDNGTVMDLLEDDSFSPDLLVMDTIVREETIKGLKVLQDRERQVIWYRYALDGGERYTLKRVSATMGISPETVRQIEMKAIRKLRDQAGHLREMMTN